MTGARHADGVARVSLRPLAPRDADELRRIRATPEVSRWWDPFEDAFPRTEKPGQRFFAIDLAGATVGFLQISEEADPKHRHAEIDLFVEPALHGRGVGSEAIRRAVRYLVEEQCHHRVTVCPAASNVPSIRACAKAGFKRVGVMHACERDVDGGGWHDGLLMEFVVAEATVHTAHTSALDASTLAAARGLVFEAFDGRLSPLDWEHGLGGVHALLWEDEELVGHGSVVQRTLVHLGRAHRVGYVEGVAVRVDRRGLGHGSRIMEALEEVIREGHEFGALSSTDAALGFYEHRAWQRWRGPTSALTPRGLVPDDQEPVFVLPGDATLDTAGELTCDWRDGDLW